MYGGYAILLATTKLRLSTCNKMPSTSSGMSKTLGTADISLETSVIGAWFDVTSKSAMWSCLTSCCETECGCFTTFSDASAIPRRMCRGCVVAL